MFGGAVRPRSQTAGISPALGSILRAKVFQDRSNTRLHSPRRQGRGATQATAWHERKAPLAALHAKEEELRERAATADRMAEDRTKEVEVLEDELSALKAAHETAKGHKKA